MRSLVGAGIICLSSFFVAFSQKRKSTAKTAGARWERSVVRLDREAGAAAEEEEAAAAGVEAGSGSPLHAPLLGGRLKGGAALGGRGSAAASLGGDSAEEWASAREGSHASLAFADGEWWDAASAGEGGAVGGLKADVKEAAAAAVAAAAAAEVEQPDTPAAPAALPMAAHAPHSGAEGGMLPLLGARSEASSSSDRLYGSSPPGGASPPPSEH